MSDDKQDEKVYTADAIICVFTQSSNKHCILITQELGDVEEDSMAKAVEAGLEAVDFDGAIAGQFSSDWQELVTMHSVEIRPREKTNG